MSAADLGGVVAIIPARGGSVGVPGKNLAPVGGVPLVGRAVRAALATTSVDLVVVSTDDPTIAAVAAAHGARVLERPAELASAVASSESVIAHALSVLVEQDEPVREIALLIQCTSPFITPDDIDLVVTTLRKSGADSCMTVSPTHGFLWRQDSDGCAVAVNHDEFQRERRQARPAEYVETGAVYGFRTGGFLLSGRRFFGTTVLAVVDPRRTLEVDEPFDLELARLQAPLLDGPRFRRPLPRPVDAVVFDFDGVMTDNRAIVLSGGEEGVLVDRGDGLGIARFRRESAAAVLVLSTEADPVVQRRCRKLGLECQSDVADKGSALAAWLVERRIDPAHCVYVGNDVNDLECVRLVGFAVAPANAVDEIKAAADVVLARSGGHGAVRELVDLLLAGATAAPDAAIAQLSGVDIGAARVLR